MSCVAEVAGRFDHFVDDSRFGEAFSVPQAARRAVGD
jgi:hypothetical protein